MRNRWNIFAFTVLCLVFAGMSLYLILHPDRTGVVPNYRSASTHWWASQEIYEPGTHGFLYAPPFAVLFTPFNLLSPAVLGEIVWRLLGFTWFGLGLWRLAKVLNARYGGVGITSGNFLWMVLLAIPASLASINNGQTNLCLSAVLVHLCLSIRSSRWNIAASCLTIALVLKPISLAPWLLSFAVFPAIRIPLLAGLVGLGVIGFLHPNPTYAAGQWVAFWNKLTHSYTPENLRVSDLFGLWEKTGMPNPLLLNTLTRSLAAISALWFILWKYRREGVINASWGLWFATVMIWTIFNPRAETNSYVIISPLLAFAAVSYWREVQGQWWKGAILAIACIGLMCDGMGKTIYLATDVWLKPLIVLLVSPLLFRMPDSWKPAS